MESIDRNPNGHEGTPAFVFIALLIGISPSGLDEGGLQKLLPTCRIERFHRDLQAGWRAYLKLWATSQIDSRSPEEIADWMMSRRGERTFQALGEIRGAKSRARKAYLDWLHRQEGKGIRLTIFDCF